MGKKVKSKGRNPRRVPARASSGSVQSEPRASDPKEDADGGDVMDGESCSHYNRESVQLNQVLLGISSSNVASACEDCRDDSPARMGGGKKGKPQKKREVHLFWICLDCNRCFCGGAVNDSVPYGHARRHWKQEHHDLMVRLDKPSSGWCFSCNLAIHIELPNVLADAGEAKSVGDDKRVEVSEPEPLILQDGKGYVIRGLSNLGNTCFFNSVMQNLLAIDLLRQFMVSLNRPIGPLTMTLKKLFSETSIGATTKGVLNPKNLFGCICSKAPQFRGYQQQDSHELLRCLLDGLYAEERNARKEQDSSGEGSPNFESTLVDNIFGGQLSSTVRCVECGHSSTVHEPFLDLSLPVPSKKSTSKKAPPPPPKRKPPPKERNKSRKFREKASARGSVIMPHCGPEERDTSSVEYCESSDPPKTEEDNNWGTAVPETSHVASEAEGSSWMDYLAEPTMTSDALELATQSSNLPDSSQLSQNENKISISSEVDDSHIQPKVSSDSNINNFSGNDTSSSCVHDAGVILLPYEALDCTTGVVTGVTSSHSPDNESSSGNSVKEQSVQAVVVANSEQAEVEFDGFGDLFNEPEVTSELKPDTGMAEEAPVTLWANNSCETNQEVDNSENIVSIESCLALFTNMELLSDEHAWYCEHCSEALSSGMITDEPCKSDLLPTLGNTNMMKLQDEGDECTTEKNSLGYQVSDLHSTGLSNIGNRGTASVSAETELLSEKRNSEQKSYIGCGSEEVKFKNEAAGNDKVLPDYKLHDQIDKPNGITENQEFGDSRPEQIESDKTVSVKEEVQVSGQALAANLTSSVHDTGENLTNPCRNGKLAINLCKKGSNLSGQACAAQDIRVKKKEPAKKKVKRDATKRILISKTPPILTIHLKRFSQDARGRLSKLRGHVLFQEILDLRLYLDPRCEEKENCSYSLFGVVEHSGGMSGGHYIAYVRGQRDSGKARKDVNSSSWFYASDAHIREAALSEVLQSEAYILFYEKM
ncbi:ubiquitin carboxyl-terminal hydrolase 2-like [Curcuma longa]|uniref:ubiquitin carboxyl-terminal hydrolase 2-like n=1 Tax=Curcuma longa TaxID=136217 RepID=UPI003D9E20C4